MTMNWLVLSYLNNVIQLRNPWMHFLFHKKFVQKTTKRRYNTDHDFSLAARMKTAVSLVSIEYIYIEFEELEKNFCEDLKLTPNWFKNVYIECQNCNRTQR
ncbi:hypothetical protein MXB_4534, partial [Myxobolus squamalis]